MLCTHSSDQGLASFNTSKSAFLRNKINELTHGPKALPLCLGPASESSGKVFPGMRRVHDLGGQGRAGKRNSSPETDHQARASPLWFLERRAAAGVESASKHAGRAWPGQGTGWQVGTSASHQAPQMTAVGLRVDGVLAETKPILLLMLLLLFLFKNQNSLQHTCF